MHVWAVERMHVSPASFMVDIPDDANAYRDVRDRLLQASKRRLDCDGFVRACIKLPHRSGFVRTQMPAICHDAPPAERHRVITGGGPHRLVIRRTEFLILYFGQGSFVRVFEPRDATEVERPLFEHPCEPLQLHVSPNDRIEVWRRDERILDSKLR